MYKARDTENNYIQAA